MQKSCDLPSRPSGFSRRDPANQDLQAELPERFLPLDLGRHRSVEASHLHVLRVRGGAHGRPASWSLEPGTGGLLEFTELVVPRFRVRWVHSPNRFGQRTAQLCTHRVVCTGSMRRCPLGAAPRTAFPGARYFRSRLQLGAFAPLLVKIRRPARAAKSNSTRNRSEMVVVCGRRSAVKSMECQ